MYLIHISLEKFVLNGSNDNNWSLVYVINGLVPTWQQAITWINDNWIHSFIENICTIEYFSWYLEIFLSLSRKNRSYFFQDFSGNPEEIVYRGYLYCWLKRSLWCKYFLTRYIGIVYITEINCIYNTDIWIDKLWFELYIFRPIFVGNH